MLSLLPLETPAGCNCCTDPALLQWHRVAKELDPAQSFLALREDKVVQEEGEDAFLDDELAIAAALAVAWVKLGAWAKDKILSAIAGSFSTYNLQGAIDEVTPAMGNLFAEAESAVARHIQSSLSTGVGAVSATATTGLPIQSTPSAKLFEEALIKATRYSTNNFFNTQIVPSIMRSVDQALNRLDVTPLSEIQALIAQHFRTVPYWGLVANVAASRGYHYGMLRSMQSQGIVAYRFVAVVDARTSAVCKAMNGKEFLVAEAVNLMDGLASDTDPMAAKTRTPWVSADIVTGRSSRDLAGIGVMLPPLHPFCRSTIQPIYG